MGGRGASSGGGGGGGGGGAAYTVTLKKFTELNNGASAIPSPMPGSQLQLQPFQTVGDYTANNNADLVKWQGQTDDKSASYLAKLDNQTDLNKIQQSTNDPYAFYNNPLQKMVSSMGLNDKATVLSESDFNKLQKQTGATVLYRGWSGQNSVDRFKNSPNTHVGNGINGDGLYFSPNKGTAQGYGHNGMKAMLSPNARVISATAVRQEIAKRGGKLQSALGKAGHKGTRTYGSNSGEAQMALKLGYNVIDAGWAVIPITRDALVVSDKRAW